jgi:hypothetical protein
MVRISERTKIAFSAISYIIGVFVILFLIDFFVFQSIFGYESFISYIFSTPIAYFSIIVFAITLVVGCFLPGRVGRIVRILSYITLFIFLLFVEIQIIKPFLKRTEVDLQECTNFFSPSQTTGNVVYDLLTYSSCILSGYVPKDLSSIGWVTFFIFYIILPFAFIWVFVYALMKEVFSGWGIERFSSLLSFIVAMYGARVLFGAVLLEFFAYGAWGLAGIFIAMFLVKGLEKIIERGFEIEKYAEEIRKYYVNQEIIKQQYADIALEIVRGLKNSLSLIFSATGKSELKGRAKILREITFYQSLDKDSRDLIEKLINKFDTAVDFSNRQDAQKALDDLENILKTWKK